MQKNKIRLFSNHPYCLSAIIISILFATIPCILCFVYFLPENKISGLLFFIPTIIIIFLCYLSNLCKNNYLKIFKILIVILNLLILFVLQTIFGFIFLILLGMDDNDTVIDNPARYNIILERVGEDKMIFHFPKEIPTDAENVSVYKSTNSFFGGHIIYLSFTISKEYIENELKKYNYIKIEGPFEKEENYKSVYNYPRGWVFSKYNKPIIGYKIYVIGNNHSERTKSHRASEYGIAVNEKTSTIMYYASNPD